MEINIQNTKLELIQWLTTLEDKSLIEKILDLRKSEISNWVNDSSENELQSIKKGITDADNGNLKPHSEARKVYEKWL